MVNEGKIEVDKAAALTGESLPLTKFHHSNFKMGSTVVEGKVILLPFRRKFN